MASISELLQKIMSARFGKDVRSSIHDAISAMNEESEAAKSAAITAQNSAQASATSAATSATSAQESATSASTSVTEADAKVTEADGFAKLAESYAKGGTGTREGEDTNNAKYYADKGNEIYNNFIENELDIQMVGYPTPPQLKMKNYRDAEGIYHQTTSRVDLGTLNLTYNLGEKPYFTAKVPNATQIIDASVLGNIYCEEYTEVDFQKIYTYKAGDLAIGVGMGYIYIRDYRYTDSTSFLDAHRGVYAYFSIYPDIEITNSDVIERLNEKVDKIEGKGLSTNDYTTDEKNKLAGIASGATANVGTITEIKMNGASKGTSGSVDLGTVLTSHQDISGKQDKLTAGDNITITNNVISASGGKGEGFVQEVPGVYNSWKFEKGDSGLKVNPQDKVEIYADGGQSKIIVDPYNESKMVFEEGLKIKADEPIDIENTDQTSGIIIGYDPETEYINGIKMYADGNAGDDGFDGFAKFALMGDDPSLLSCANGLDIISENEGAGFISQVAQDNEIAITNYFNTGSGSSFAEGINRIKLNYDDSTDKGALVLGHYYDIGSGVPDSEAQSTIKLDTDNISLNVLYTDGMDTHIKLTQSSVVLSAITGDDNDSAITVSGNKITINSNYNYPSSNAKIELEYGKVSITAPNGLWVNGTRLA